MGVQKGVVVELQRSGIDEGRAHADTRTRVGLDGRRPALTATR